MCYNCGCGLPDDDMGQGHALAQPNGKSITNQTFEELAKKWNLTPEQAKEKVYEMLNHDHHHNHDHTHDDEKEHFVEELEDAAAKSQGMNKEQAEQETTKLLHKVLKK